MFRRVLFLAGGLVLAGVAHGADAPVTPPGVSGITVIGVAPLPGTGVDVDKSPSAVQTLSAAELNGASRGLAGALEDRLASVSLGDNLADTFQPDLLLRGFEASPVLGTPQAVAVYQNGARINEAFGETVNWDLIPDIAIRRADVQGANPVFGLNALGGAVTVQMKNGFSDDGGEAVVSGGAFRRREASLQWGGHTSSLGAYVALRGLDEDGWRAFSANRLRQAYGGLTARLGALAVDLSATVADNRLHGQSAAPVQELAVNRALVFTNPQQVDNRLTFLTLESIWTVSPVLSLQGVAYYRRLRQETLNGNTIGYAACSSQPGLLCQPDGLTVVTGADGAALPDISLGGTIPIGAIDRQSVRSESGGISLQAALTLPVWGRPNHLTLGASLDDSITAFASTAAIGPVDAALTVGATGLVVVTPEGSDFNATPVGLHAGSTYLGLYATDTFDLTSRLSVTASGRYNRARIDLVDRHGTDLNGRNRYERFNPALGAAWRITDGLTAYAGYAEGSRAPNASEIECSNPLIPCLLPSTLASDPPTLRQVVSLTWEAGLRGRFKAAGGAVRWSAGVFRADVRDDIYSVATTLSAGYFQNIGGTRREGVEAFLGYEGRRLSAFAAYGYVDATFRSAFVLPSPLNPGRDAAGDISVHAGDRLPGIPRHRLRLGADYMLRPGWTLGARLTVAGDQTYRGDEIGAIAPLAGYAVVSLRSDLKLTSGLALFAAIDNALDSRYATFGILGDPTGVGAPGVPTQPGAADPRFQSPAAPIAARGGLRLTF